MDLRSFNPSQAGRVVELFTSVFTEAEDESEGQLIGDLVATLIAETEPADLQGFVALEREQVVACIFFSRLWVSNDVPAFILSPVAVSSANQRRGIGERLIQYGLDSLKALGVELVFTYGDPNYYSRTGFLPISESVVQAPQTLSQPEGWLAQSLTGQPITATAGRARCVAALDKAVYW